MFDSVLRILIRTTLLLAAFAVTAIPQEASAKSRRGPVQASIVIDADTGKVLRSDNADTTTYPASLTKMMTLYMLFDRLESGKMKLTDRIKISAHAAGQPPSKLGLRPGQTIRVEDAILALVTKSANDVAAALGEAIGGTEANFGKMMTERARALGMWRTTFKNASGLPNRGQVTTARDMATLGRALLRDHPQYYGYFSTPRFTWKGRTMTSHNRLMLRYEGADGIKTGYINASGFNLVSSVKRDGHRLIGVVLGGRTAASRDRRMEKLLTTTFASLPSGGEKIQVVSVPKPKPDLDAALVARALPKPKPELMQVALDADAVDEHIGAGDAEEADWGVQIGAFVLKVSAKNAAEKAHKQHTELLRRGEPKVMPVKKGRKTIWRARVMGITEDQARALCDAMADNKSCMVVSPGV